MDKVLDRATEVFGSRDEAFHWILAPNETLSHQTPFSMLMTPEGIKTVMAVLSRIELKNDSKKEWR